MPACPHAPEHLGWAEVACSSARKEDPLPPVTSTNVPSRDVDARPNDLEHARRNYLCALEHACPTDDAAVADLACVFAALLGASDPVSGGELDRARATYLASLRGRLPDRDARVRDLARVFGRLLALRRAAAGHPA